MLKTPGPAAATLPGTRRKSSCSGTSVSSSRSILCQLRVCRERASSGHHTIRGTSLGRALRSVDVCACSPPIRSNVGTRFHPIAHRSYSLQVVLTCHHSIHHLREERLRPKYCEALIPVDVVDVRRFADGTPDSAITINMFSVTSFPTVCFISRMNYYPVASGPLVKRTKRRVFLLYFADRRSP